VLEFVVDFNVTFSVVIEAESERDAVRLAEDDDWREDVLDNRTAWDELSVETEVYELEEDDY
jgi:hypothetical protein